MSSTWRTGIPQWAWDGHRPTQEPPEEPDGPCEAFGCPRTGTDATGVILCGFHRGQETPRASRRTTGHRSNE